ncbi:MAG: thioredoxin [Bacilli bacterium]|nr:thioredoxin [Bacilli bacterium]MBO6286921.1 thioredoxin [Bacilli bacterium]
MITHIQNVQQFDELLAKGDVLVDFFATWCGPCNMLTPVVEKLSEENPDLTVLKVDVDEIGDLAARYGVSSIPTLLYCKDGELVDRGLGYMPLPRLKSFVRR